MVLGFESASAEGEQNSYSHASPTGSLTPTEPPTPDGFLHPPLIKGNKPIPYIVQLPNGGCEYKFPVNADFNYRSRSPTPPSTPKPTMDRCLFGKSGE
ncbi:hypothetical protein BT69DRAFT_1358962 [Atractiella rhizophila]|nr:hypothetical protein BT69DRAFT_1358962 [Atractiella rhizophila]